MRQTWLEQTLKAGISGLAWSCSRLVPGSLAQAPTLQEQLVAQYKPVKMGSDTSGYSVVEKGTLLEFKREASSPCPMPIKAFFPSKYEGGTVHGPNGLSVMGRKSTHGTLWQQSQGQTTHLFQVGRQSLSHASRC